MRLKIFIFLSGIRRNKNKEVEIFFKLFFQHREEFLKINFCYWSFDVIGKNFSFRD